MPTLHNIPPGAHHRGFVTAAQGYLRNVSNNIAMTWHVVNDIIQNTADTVNVQGGHRPDQKGLIFHWDMPMEPGLLVFSLQERHMFRPPPNPMCWYVYATVRRQKGLSGCL